MMGHSDGEVKWKVGVDQGAIRSNHRLRCLKSSLGCLLSRGEHRGSIVSTRENQAYKLSRIDRSYTCPKDISEKQDRLVGVVYINNQGGTVSKELVHLT